MHGSKHEDAAWSGALEAALARSPQPEQTRRLAERVLDALPHGSVDHAPPTTLAHVFFALCGVAPFFGPSLLRHPDWLERLLAEDYGQSLSREDMSKRLEAWLEAAEDDGATALRRFKYYELARITVRDCCEEWLPLERSSETLAELSQLADLLLDAALRLAMDEVAQRCGPPRWRSPEGEEIELDFCVLGLGKLGSEELNYSSDVDLVYVFQAPGCALQPLEQGGTELLPAEYFTRLAQSFGPVVHATSVEGFLYRVDLELRPEGGQGSLVVSHQALADYYEVWASTWEKATFMKARPVAGCEDLGWRTIRSLDPMIFRSAMDYAGVQSIRSLKAKVAEARGEGEAGFNVKIDSGGIRDVEFIAQAMQLLHGGRILQLRNRSTQKGLQSLQEVGLLPAPLVDDLLDAYRFLRRVENRLQMEAERQTHVVPRKAAAFERLARSLGYTEEDGPAQFEEALNRQRARVVDVFRGFLAEDGTERVLEIFSRSAPNLVAIQPTRGMIESLAQNFSRSIDASADPERALNNLERFIQGVGRRRFYYNLLLDRPELVPRLSTLFATSRFLSNLLASHPRLIEPVFEDPDALVPTRGELVRDLDELAHGAQQEDADTVEFELDALRLFYHRHILNVGLLDIAGRIERPAAEMAMTQIAEICVERALTLSRAWTEERAAELSEATRQGEFLVIAMGKFASRELSYGSDLDLVFLFDVADAAPHVVVEAQEHFVKLAQRFISTLQTRTAQGACYEIDARLRPSGSQGILVTSIESFRRYHESTAETWERMILLRSRPVAGSKSLAAAFEALRLEILGQAVPQSLAEDTHRIRQRMEQELAKETSVRRDFKTGRGGILDVENLVQLLQLTHGKEHPELLEVDRMEAQLEKLETLSLLDASSLDSLRKGWDFLQQLSNRMRIVENRSISDLNQERGDLEGLAHRMGYGSPGPSAPQSKAASTTSLAREGGAKRALLNDYHHHTETIREIYSRVLGEEPVE